MMKDARMFTVRRSSRVRGCCGCCRVPPERRGAVLLLVQGRRRARVGIGQGTAGGLPAMECCCVEVLVRISPETRGRCSGGVMVLSEEEGGCFLGSGAEMWQGEGAAREDPECWGSSVGERRL